MTTLLLAACLALSGARGRITAGDLAPQETFFAALPPDTSLGFAPAPGERRVFHRVELARLAARYPSAAVPAEDICVEIPTAPLDPPTLVAAMRKIFPEATIEILEHSRYPAPAGEIEFPANGLMRPAQPDSPALWRGWVHYSESRRFAIWARVRMTIEIPRVLARVNLPAGRPIAADDLQVETWRGFPPRELPARAIAEAAGRAPRCALRAGSPLVPRMLTDAPEVARGDLVAVEVRTGQTRLELQARAESAGARGQTIALRNPSGRRFLARVAGPGRAEAPGDPR